MPPLERDGLSCGMHSGSTKEGCGRTEETLRVWWERWGEVEVRLSVMKITHKDKWWAGREEELRGPLRRYWTLRTTAIIATVARHIQRGGTRIRVQGTNPATIEFQE